MEQNRNVAVSISKRARMVDDLPDEILLKIFHRLPINSVGLCMCVKKPWLSLIKNPQFISSYKTPDKDRYFIFYENFHDLRLHHDNERFEFHTQFTLPIQIIEYNSDISVCNGVVCFANNDSMFFLWNPTIDKMINLPRPNFIPRVGRGIPVFGFAFDSKANDYKVVRILNSLKCGKPNIEVFSLNNNSWTTVSAPRYFFVENDPLPIMNGALHWIGKNTEHILGTILGFDVNAETFREIQVPSSLDHLSLSISFKLEVYKESFLALCCFDFESGDNLDIWLMNEYGNVESWTRVWKFNFSEFNTPRHMPFATHMLRLRNNGEVMFWVKIGETDRMIISVNPETLVENVIYTETREPSTSFGCFNYFEKSLVLLENADAVRCPTIDTCGDRMETYDVNLIEFCSSSDEPDEWSE